MSASEQPSAKAGDGERDSRAASGAALREKAHARKRSRRKIAGFLREDPVTTGTIELMTGTDQRPLLHRLVLRGQQLTAAGGPARVVLDLVEELTRSIDAIMPGSDPYLQAVRGSNSVEVIFYPPEDEVRLAEVRLEDAREVKRVDVKADDEDEQAEPPELPSAQVLPDTTLAVLALTRIMSIKEPEEAARAAKRIGQTAAAQVRDLALELHETGITLHADDVRPDVAADPEWALRVVEHLDADEELEPVNVTVLGVLQGADAGGDGTFAIVTDEDLPLDPAFGSRRNPGDKLRGELTSRSTDQISRFNLWNSHVRATIELYRRRKGAGIRVEGMRLIDVAARFRHSPDSE